MYSTKRFINDWEYLKGSFPEFPMQQRIFHSISMVTFFATLFNIFWALSINAITESILFTVLLFIEATLFYLSRFLNRLQIAYTIWACIFHIAIVVAFLHQGGFSVGLWNCFIINFISTLLIANKKHYNICFGVHSLVFLVLLLIEYRYPHIIIRPDESREFFYFKVLYSSIASFVFLQAYINFVIVNYTNKRKKLECQRAESELRGERLKELNEQKNRIISVISHDFNTPLNNIKRYLHLMQQVELDNEKRKMLENELLLVTIDTQNLLANLLTWSKNNMEGIQFTPEIVNVNDAIIYTKDLYHDIAKEKNIHIKYQIENDVHVMGNYEMIDIILRNFISNAIKFTAEGGSVIVSATRDKDLYKLSVLDNGKGFPESQLQKLFVSSVESTPGTRHEKGAGIGLSIAKEFVEMMNGRIGFNSQLNNGTEFYIYLPAVDYHEDHDIL